MALAPTALALIPLARSWSLRLRYNETMGLEFSTHNEVCQSTRFPTSQLFSIYSTLFPVLSTPTYPARLFQALLSPASKITVSKRQTRVRVYEVALFGPVANVIAGPWV